MAEPEPEPEPEEAAEPEVEPEAGKSSDEVRSMFDQFDEDGGGSIGPSEFKELCSALEYEGDVAAALKELDGDGDGEISFEEFKKWWDLVMTPPDPDDEPAADEGAGSGNANAVASSLATFTASDTKEKLRSSKAARPPRSDTANGEVYGPGRPKSSFADHILKIDVLGTDALRPDRRMLHPCVRLHLVDISNKQYLQKKDKSRSVTRPFESKEPEPESFVPSHDVWGEVLKGRKSYLKLVSDQNEQMEDLWKAMDKEEGEKLTGDAVDALVRQWVGSAKEQLSTSWAEVRFMGARAVCTPRCRSIPNPNPSTALPRRPSSTPRPSVR
jgi:hypothetical protein